MDLWSLGPSPLTYYCIRTSGKRLSWSVDNRTLQTQMDHDLRSRPCLARELRRSRVKEFEGCRPSSAFTALEQHCRRIGVGQMGLIYRLSTLTYCFPLIREESLRLSTVSAQGRRAPFVGPCTTTAWPHHRDLTLEILCPDGDPMSSPLVANAIVLPIFNERRWQIVVIDRSLTSIFFVDPWAQ